MHLTIPAAPRSRLGRGVSAPGLSLRSVGGSVLFFSSLFSGSCNLIGRNRRGLQGSWEQDAVEGRKKLCVCDVPVCSILALTVFSLLDGLLFLFFFLTFLCLSSHIFTFSSTSFPLSLFLFSFPNFFFFPSFRGSNVFLSSQASYTSLHRQLFPAPLSIP